MQPILILYFLNIQLQFPFTVVLIHSLGPSTFIKYEIMAPDQTKIRMSHFL